jgi:arylsulfatase A-like enzyme
VAVTSDHGEALAGDHGYYFSHANGATEDQLHVPLVLACPGWPSGSEVERPVSTVDLLPTLVALLGLEVPSGHTLDGVSLLADEPRPVYARAPEEVSLRSGDWKGIWNLRGGGGRLFDLAADPGELRDLAAEDPERLAVLAGRLRELHQRPVLAKPRMRPPPEPRRARELEALGYL